MKYVLTSKKEKAAFPDNETFADCLRTKNIYAMLPRYKAYLFERIENGDSNEYKDIYGRLDSGEYTIEHIMPQKLTPAWTSELGQDAENIHGEWLHTLANLTLTAYNSKYSNAPFNEKKTMADGYLQSGIIIQRHFLILLLRRSIAAISIGPQRRSLLCKVFTAFFKFRKAPVFFLCNPLSHSDTTL